MTDKLRAAAEAALEAWDTRAGIDTASKAFEALRAALAEPEVQSTHSAECYKWHHECARAEVERLRAALAEQDAAEWEVDYEVRVDTGYEEMWVAEASTVKEALRYAPQYVDEGTVRVYERRIKVIATMEARND